MDDSGRNKRLTTVEDDRLSNLPDDLIYKILYDASIKHVMTTSVLSKRWRFLWALTPYLNFSAEEFPNLPEFSKFVRHFLSRRNNQLPVFSVKLVFCGMVSQEFVKSITDYGFSHNLQQLTVTLLLEDRFMIFPLSLFTSKSLKHLTLNSPSYNYLRLVSTWELPALSTLHLNNVALFGHDTRHETSLFSKCVNLKNLTLRDCRVEGPGLRICLSQLSDLTLINLGCKQNYRLDVVAPQLKNLTLENYYVNPRICSPRLASLSIHQDHSTEFISVDGFRSLEKADLYLRYPCPSDAPKILGHIQLLHNVKFLTLNLQIIQFLSSCLDLISHQPCPFANLKSLKIYQGYEYWFEDTKVTMSTRVINYFLDSSLSTTWTVISHKDIRREMNYTSAHNLMCELLEFLEHKKTTIRTNKAHIKHATNYLQDSSSSANLTIISLTVLIDRDRIKRNAHVMALLEGWI